ncbi:MAG: hypothetical protein KA388_05420, partial [Rhodocyclaceae bacterium]|nr:hypothetical protein [Rhodocyclaceae bacterium]
KYGIMPGIKTIDKVADDVVAERLQISNRDIAEGVGARDVAFLNSKGFGGNNATAAVYSPRVVEKMLLKRYGEAAFADYTARREATRKHAAAYDAEASRGNLQTIYQFGENMIDESAITIASTHLTLPGFAHAINLPTTNPFGDMV